MSITDGKQLSKCKAVHSSKWGTPFHSLGPAILRLAIDCCVFMRIVLTVTVSISTALRNHPELGAWWVCSHDIHFIVSSYQPRSLIECTPSSIAEQYRGTIIAMTGAKGLECKLNYAVSTSMPPLLFLSLCPSRDA